jgi:hypothetical protein
VLFWLGLGVFVLGLNLLTICSAERSSSWDGGTCFASSHAGRAGLSRSTSWGCHVGRGHVLKSGIARSCKQATIGMCSHVCVELYKHGAQRPRHILTQYLQVIQECTKCAKTLDGTRESSFNDPSAGHFKPLNCSQPFSAGEQSAVCPRRPACFAQHTASSARPCGSASQSQCTCPGPRFPCW